MTGVKFKPLPIPMDKWNMNRLDPTKVDPPNLEHILATISSTRSFLYIVWTMKYKHVSFFIYGLLQNPTFFFQLMEQDLKFKPID